MKLSLKDLLPEAQEDEPITTVGPSKNAVPSESEEVRIKRLLTRGTAQECIAEANYFHITTILRTAT